jgi:transmembrane 9 superfamily member 2/4
MTSLSRVLTKVGCFWLLFWSSNAATKFVNPFHEVKSRQKKKESTLLAHVHHAISSRGTLVKPGQVKDKTMSKLENNKRLNRVEVKEVAPAEEYMMGEQVWIYADLVESKKTHKSYEYYDLPGCPLEIETEGRKRKRMRENLGAPLQGHDMKPAPFELYTLQDKPCTPLCLVRLEGKKLRLMRKIIERQYRVQLLLDSLPVLMRSQEFGYAVRGYPVGFRAPVAATESRRYKPERADVYLYNHLKFAITYHEDPKQFNGVRITGFDVHPVSINHDVPTDGVVTANTPMSTCQGMDVENGSENYMNLSYDQGDSISVVFSYDIQWIKNDDLQWADRWDVYFVGAPDDDIHNYSIVNLLMIVLFMMGAIATIMIRTLRKDIAGYNELQTLEEAQ